MANEVSVPAFRTRLGNSPAKMVLVTLADMSNTEGFSWPKVSKIATLTELSERTVLRVLQVFQAMGMVTKVEVSDDRYKCAFQINLSMLGRNHSKEFKRLLSIAQGKAEGVSETQKHPKTVPETTKSVSETVIGVSETNPPHPLLGRTITEPPVNIASDLFETPADAAKRKLPDTLWHRVIAEIDRLYQLANPDVPVPWEGLAFKRLRSLMEKHKKWTEDLWLTCIRNRFKSENINAGAPPADFINDLPRYVRAPLNKFNHDQETGHATGKQNIAARNAAARDATHARIDRAAAEGDF